jgi:hypothetical protein
MRALAIGLLLLAAATPAPAQDDQHALAERAVVALYEHDIAARIMEVFWPVALEVIKERVPGVNGVQLFQYRSKAETFAGQAAHAGLVPLVDLFEHGFTPEELAALVAFYETPAGMKFNGAQGTIASVLSGAAGDSLKAEINGLRQKVDDMLAADGY